MSKIPLVLLHGFPLDSRFWQAQVESLSNRFRLITPDLGGFGKNVSSDPFTIASQADDLHEFLKSQNALPCVLGGLSMGGYVSLAFARKYAADLKGLILIDTRAEADTAAGKENRDRLINLAKEKGTKAVVDVMFPKMISPQTTEHRPDIVQKLRHIMESQSPQTVQHALAAMRDREDYTQDLPTITLPVLVVVGEEDAITPPALATSMSQSLKQAKLIIVPKAGHSSPMEQPELVTAALRKFMEKIGQGDKVRG